MKHQDYTAELPEGESILPMQQSDLAAVHQLESVSQEDPWSRQHFADELANPVASIDLYWCGDKIAGFLCSWLIAGELQIQNLATLPAMRRRKVAARLMEHVIKRSKERGLTAVWLEVRAGNSAAIALYKRFGFEISGTRSAYYPDGEDALIMACQVNS